MTDESHLCDLNDEAFRRLFCSHIKHDISWLVKLSTWKHKSLIQAMSHQIGIFFILILQLHVMWLYFLTTLASKYMTSKKEMDGKIFSLFCPIFSSFGFWYFGHFFFPFFLRLVHLALQNVNKNYVIFLYFRNFIPKVTKNQKWDELKHLLSN